MRFISQLLSVSQTYLSLTAFTTDNHNVAGAHSIKKSFVMSFSVVQNIYQIRFFDSISSLEQKQVNAHATQNFKIMMP